MPRASYSALLFSLIVCTAFGCGRGDLPELAPVTGTITIDGKPYPNGFVQFFSQGGGRPGTGSTDENGKYEIKYLHGVDGARVGINRVEISTEWPDGEPPIGESDPIGEEYNTKSTLTADVKDEDNVFNFDLQSKKSTPKK
ncbi:MAG: carboxypeptidase regulatory-like domain-containing protein [Planctomyces sp.]|jgi:hypothetical protein